MYEVLLEKQVEKDLKKLPIDLFRRIVPAIQNLSGEPRPVGCLKLKTSLQDYRIRVGDYRIIYEIDDKSQIVRIMRVRHIAVFIQVRHGQSLMNKGLKPLAYTSYDCTPL